MASFCYGLWFGGIRNSEFNVSSVKCFFFFNEATADEDIGLTEA